MELVRNKCLCGNKQKEQQAVEANTSPTAPASAPALNAFRSDCRGGNCGNYSAHRYSVPRGNHRGYFPAEGFLVLSAAPSSTATGTAPTKANASLVWRSGATSGGTTQA
jgi:hypothetical protein